MLCCERLEPTRAKQMQTKRSTCGNPACIFSKARGTEWWQ